MQSLRVLLTKYPTLLLIDSASVMIQVGLLRADRPPVWESSGDEAGSGIYAATEAVLTRAACTLEEVAAFVFCDGPGSVLGIRTAAVAIRTWCVLRARPAFAYHSLELVANFQLHTGIEPPFTVIADARRSSWHATAVAAPKYVSPLLRLAPGDLSGVLFMLENFRHWGTLPPEVRWVPYNLSAMFDVVAETALFREAEEPEAFLHEDPVYLTWTPKVHRAPL